MLKKLLGLAPLREEDGSFSPSKLALKLATSDKTDYEEVSYTKYKGERSKVLVIFTEHKNMKMKNGKLFSTGNHPVEALLPSMYVDLMAGRMACAILKNLDICCYTMYFWAEKTLEISKSVHWN